MTWLSSWLCLAVVLFVVMSAIDLLLYFFNSGEIRHIMIIQRCDAVTAFKDTIPGTVTYAMIVSAVCNLGIYVFTIIV